MPDLVDKFLIISSSPGGYSENLYPGKNGKEIWKFNQGNTDSLIRDTDAEDAIENQPINELIQGKYKKMSKSPFKPRNKTWVDASTFDIQGFRNKMIFIMEKINDCCDAINELNDKVENLETQFGMHQSQLTSDQSQGPGPHGSNYANSDRAFKKEAFHVFDSPKGYPVWIFKYRNSQTGSYGTDWYQGTMAQDLNSRFQWVSGSTENHPSASIVNSGSNAAISMSDGYYSVDYSKLDISFKTLTEEQVMARIQASSSLQISDF